MCSYKINACADHVKDKGFILKTYQNLLSK